VSYKSQFGYILDLLELTGKDLAEMIKVDRTLVSKWKNNARPLKQKSLHFDAIVQTFIISNHKRKDTVLERFFRKIYPNIDLNEPDYLETCLTLWLKGQDLGLFSSINSHQKSEKALYSANIEIFQGNQGKRDALLILFDYALELPPGQEIFISDLEENSWLTEDQAFYDLYTNKVNELSTYGHNVIIIYSPIHNSEDLLNFDYLKLTKYFTGRVTTYMIGANQGFGPSLFIIHKHMLLLSMDSDSSGNRYVSLYRDPVSIQQMVKMFAVRLERAQPMISTYSSHGTSLKGFTENLLTVIDDLDDAYFLSPMPPFSTMPDQLLSDILSDNQANDQQMFELMQMHKLNKKLFYRNKKRATLDAIFSKERILEALSQDMIRVDDISTLIKKEVYITRQQFIEHLQSLLVLSKEHDNFNITVASYKDIDHLSHCLIWLIKNQMLYSYPLTNEANFVISDSDYILGKSEMFMHQLLFNNEDARPLEDYLQGLS